MNKKQKKYYKSLIYFFFIYGFIGWFIDSAIWSLGPMEFVFGGAAISFGVYVPFALIYGCGAVAVIIAQPLIEKFPAFFREIMPGIIFTIVEYIGGIIGLWFFGRRLWDYSENALNLHGHTDIWHMFLWIVLGVIFVHYWHPYIRRKLKIRN